MWGLSLLEFMGLGFKVRAEHCCCCPVLSPFVPNMVVPAGNKPP